MPRSYWTRITDQRISRRRALALTGAGVGAAFLAACSGGGDDEAVKSSASPTAAAAKPRLEIPDPKIQVRSESILPKDTDAAIDIVFAEPHYVAFPVAPQRGRLFLFLHATGQFPDDYRLIADQAARNGFHAINMRYASVGYDSFTLCTGDPDPACSENAKQEQFDGTDRSAKVNVNRANSTESRLSRLLAYLQMRYPSEGWAAYVEGATPKWSAIVVAGHSQGAAQAPFIAKDRALARVAMFSGPADYLGPGGRQSIAYPPAPWLLGPHATPSDRYFAFAHAADAQYNLELQWKEMKLGLNELGPVVNVDKEPSPYRTSHLLITEAEQAPPKKPVILNHGTVIRDDVTPKAPDGQPLFAPVWQYMCFA